MKSYRVVETGQVVPEHYTQRCPWCPRRGRCRSCLGSKRIVKYEPGREGLDWPIPVVEVTSDEMEPGGCATRDLRAGPPRAPAAPAIPSHAAFPKAV